LRKTDGSDETSRLLARAGASSLTIVEFNLSGVSNMIRRNSKYLVMAAMIAFAANGNAGTTMVSPALAACSKALVESIRAEPLPVYTVKAPGGFVSDLVDKNSFTVLAHSKKTKALLAKASCKATADGEIVSFKALPLKS
jgi:hypothetical protein